MRTVLLLSSLIFSACTVGEIGTANQNNGKADAGIDAPATGNACVDRVTPAADAHIHTAGGTQAGATCLAAGCHLNNNTGTGAPAFQVAGTVYKADGTTPNPGVNIKIKPAGGGAGMTLVSDSAGNFSIAAGSIQMAFPATTDASACPTLTPMVSQLQANGGGNCNSAGCHAPGGTTGVIKLADQ